VIVGDYIVLGVSAVFAVIWAALLGALVRAFRAIAHLSAVTPAGGAPRVTVVTPACDEEGSVAATVRSFLAQKGATIDVVAIDDRSRDRTGAILDALAGEDARVTVLHVEELPEGWLGKVHALDVGVRHATGDWLLFADADVRLSPEAVARAVTYAEARSLDLVSAYPEIESAGFLGDVAWSYIGCVAGLGLSPHRLRDPEDAHAISIGAFILVRRSAFDATPGFSYIKLEVADDMGLAILMKDHGSAVDIVNGRGEVRLTWYTSLGDMVQRTQKNFFGILCRFSLARGVALAISTALVGLFPLVMCVDTSSPSIALAPLLPLALFLATAIVHAHWAARPVLPSFFVPLGALFIAFMVLRAAILGAQMGGIAWRGTVYRSETLRDVQRFVV
jgi:hypothetical protein